MLCAGADAPLSASRLQDRREGLLHLLVHRLVVCRALRLGIRRIIIHGCGLRGLVGGLQQALRRLGPSAPRPRRARALLRAKCGTVGVELVGRRCAASAQTSARG